MAKPSKKVNSKRGDRKKREKKKKKIRICLDPVTNHTTYDYDEDNA